MDIGSKIKEYRNEQGLTQVELSKRANISRSYLADVEKNRYNASVETLQKIASALGISVSKLLTIEEKLEMTTTSINKIQEMAQSGLNYTYGESSDNGSYVNEPKNLYDVNILLREFSNEEFTEDEEKEITNFINYLISKRK